jgi:hypothetical protein
MLIYHRFLRIVKIKVKNQNKLRKQKGAGPKITYYAPTYSILNGLDIKFSSLILLNFKTCTLFSLMKKIACSVDPLLLIISKGSTIQGFLDVSKLPVWQWLHYKNAKK